MRRCGAIQLLGHRRYLRRQRDLEVIAATTQVDDFGIVRVTQHPIEEPVAQGLAIASEQLECTTAERRSGNRGIALHQ
jgi:hypothetical protein